MNGFPWGKLIKWKRISFIELYMSGVGLYEIRKFLPGVS